MPLEEKWGYVEAFKAQRESHQKFNYYFLGVIVALLSLSIQTFKPESYTSFKFLIIFFWALLTVSFLSGMYRMEKIIVFLGAETESLGIKAMLDRFEEGKKGEVPLKLTEKGERMKKKSEESLKSQLVAYKIQKWAFVLALVVFFFFGVVNIYN